MSKGNYLLKTLFSWDVIGRDKVSPSTDAASCPETKEASQIHNIVLFSSPTMATGMRKIELVTQSTVFFLKADNKQYHRRI